MSNLFKGSYIKVDRIIMDWEWYKNPDTMRVFLHCLLKANFESKSWQGITIQRGQFITSYSKLANELGLTNRKIRTSLKRLTMTGELTCCPTNKYTIITVNNYNPYQNNDTKNDKQLTGDCQTNDNQMTTTNNDKNIKNDKKEKKKNFVAKSFFQKLIASDDEIKKYNFLSDSFMRFLQYKTDIKKQFKTEDSVRSAFLKFVRLSNNNVEYAEALVENTIARGWQTIYDLPKEDKSAFLKNQTQQENQEVSDKWEKYSL